MKNLTQAELAERAHLNQKTISAFEAGASGIETRTVLSILRQLDLTLALQPISRSQSQVTSRPPNRLEILRLLRAKSENLKLAGVAYLGLFGSVSRGESTAESEIDIAYEISGSPDIFSVGKIEDILQSLFDNKIDLVRFKGLREKIKETAERDMIRVI